MWKQALKHWPEYAIEAWALGTFMISAGVFTVLIEHPDFGVPAVIESGVLRRALVGIAMGATAMALIYSPWGRRSGAHMNPAVTLTFWWLGRIRLDDALAYVAAQFAGGILGVLAVLAIFGERFAGPPVSFVATLPARGAGVAFALELAISCGLMLTVLTFSSRARLAPYTGLAAGALVASYIALEAPYSGMSMNPARSFASAAPAGSFEDLWIYFLAPPLGMCFAAALHSALTARQSELRACAKLVHAEARCIHCGYEPAMGPSVSVAQVR
jgi:aquaporin Z